MANAINGKLTQFRVSTYKIHKSSPCDAGQKNYEIEFASSAPGHACFTPLRSTRLQKNSCAIG